MDTETQVRVFKALGDETRLRILDQLPDQPECGRMLNVQQLVDAVGGSQPNISRHLHILKDSGLVHCRKKCCNVYYWRDPEAFRALTDVLAAYGRTDSTDKGRKA